MNFDIIKMKRKTFSLLEFVLPADHRVKIVIYWPSAEPSIKRCTCVNKRKNSGSWGALENNITRCPGVSGELETGCRNENQLQTEGFGPFVTQGWATQAKMRKKCCYGRGRTWVNIAVHPCLHSFLTHKKHHPIENKVWEIYIFIKKCIRSLLKSSLSVDYVPVNICIHVVYYATKLKKTKRWRSTWTLLESNDDNNCNKFALK